MGHDLVDIRLLGGFSVAIGGRAVPAEQWRLKRAADLVKILALAPRHRLPREKVMEAFWPEGEPEAAATNVRKAAFHARRALGIPDAVVLDEGIVQLAPGRHVSTDIGTFLAAAAKALEGDDPAACRDAAARYGGELLPDDPYAEWCAVEREHVRSVFRDVLAGGQLWGRLVQEDPTHERAHQEMMRAHLDHGDRTAAIRQFEQLSSALRDDLGVSPQPDTINLYEQILKMDGREVPTPAERARALLAWGLVHWRRADLDEAARTADEARALAIDAQLPRELTEASELMGLIAYAQGAWRETFARSFLGSFTTTPELAPFIFDANMCMSEFALCEPTGIEDVAGLAEEMFDAADELDSTQARALGHLLRGEATLLAGDDVEQARTDLVQAADFHESASSVTAWALSVERLAQLDAVTGDHESAREHHRLALRIAGRTSVPEHLLPWIYGGMFEGEDDAAALRIITEAEAATRGYTVCDPCAMAFRINAAMACARSGRADRGRDYLTEASRVAAMWTGGPWHAAVDEAEATLQRALGAAPSSVTALLQSAANGFEAVKRTRDAARCRTTLAMLRRGNADGTPAS